MAFGDLIASEDIMLTDNGYFDGSGSPLDQTANAQNGTLTAEGRLWKTTPGNLYLMGNNDDPEHQGGKAIDLQYAGCLPAASTCEGNLELYAPNGDIQVSGDLTTFGLCDIFELGSLSIESIESSCLEELSEWYDRPTGGVSVIADSGKIYTDGASPENDTLNIGIVGNSDDVGLILEESLGVDLPYGPGKAAIVVMSSEDLNFGPDTVLIARGTYDSTVVDDRPGVGFVDAPGTAIPTGVPRDEGDPIDVAVYVASTGTDTGAGEGDVHLDGRAIDVAEGGTMVVDAYDTVTFGDFDTFDLEGFEDCGDLACFLIKLALRFHEDIDFEDLWNAAQEYEWPEEPTFEELKQSLEDFLDGYFDEGFFFNIDRMEVCSRITEWLWQASFYGTLPFAGNPADIAAFEAFIGGDYILRGAGLSNPGITDGRAWVLEVDTPPAPFGEAQVAEAEEVAFAEGGCPMLMEWLAGELGIPEETIQVYLADTFLYSTAIQPCDACARLRDAATILEDLEGTRIAALAQVVNEFVAPDAPITPEQMASIASSMVSPEADTQYAAAGEWLDALAQYVGILSAEMGFSVPESVAFVNKYLTPVAELDNASVASYVEARLSALGG
jgi:hypothetical protein